MSYSAARQRLIALLGTTAYLLLLALLPVNVKPRPSEASSNLASWLSHVRSHQFGDQMLHFSFWLAALGREDGQCKSEAYFHIFRSVPFFLLARLHVVSRRMILIKGNNLNLLNETKSRRRIATAVCFCEDNACLKIEGVG
jgi:hypothetical protein